ncbi:MAG: hypothetical protein COA43_00885 [Robiginitomaculum sp.]|nr:MAG: hypothetical protein COA43_00885 [Robiginitomaculum sp.]
MILRRAEQNRKGHVDVFYRSVTVKKTGKSGEAQIKILAVSTQLFAQYGYEGVAMRQIAKAAGITLPSIYHHFGNKEGLYRAVETSVYSTHTLSLMKALKSADTPEENLRNFVGRLIFHLQDDPLYLKILQRGLIEGWEENQTFLVEMSLQKVFDELRNLLNECKPNGGESVLPIFIFSVIIGYLTMQPVTTKLKNYKFATFPREQKQAILTETILSLIQLNTLK